MAKKELWGMLKYKGQGRHVEEGKQAKGTKKKLPKKQENQNTAVPREEEFQGQKMVSSIGRIVILGRSLGSSLYSQNPPPFSATARLLLVLLMYQTHSQLLIAVHPASSAHSDGPLLFHMVNHSSSRSYLRRHLLCKGNPAYPSPELSHSCSELEFLPLG